MPERKLGSWGRKHSLGRMLAPKRNAHGTFRRLPLGFEGRIMAHTQPASVFARDSPASAPPWPARKSTWRRRPPGTRQSAPPPAPLRCQCPRGRAFCGSPACPGTPGPACPGRPAPCSENDKEPARQLQRAVCESSRCPAGCGNKQRIAGWQIRREGDAQRSMHLR